MALVKQFVSEDGWDFRYFSIDTPSDEMGEAGPIKRIWDDKRGDAAIPSWQDFQFEDFQGYHGWVAVEDILSVEPYDAEFRLWGTQLTEIFKLDLTGKRTSEFEGIVYDKSDFEVWSEVHALRCILVSDGTMDWIEQFHYLHNKRFTDVTLPLSDDGETINRFMTVTLVRH